MSTKRGQLSKSLLVLLVATMAILAGCRDDQQSKESPVHVQNTGEEQNSVQVTSQPIKKMTLSCPYSQKEIEKRIEYIQRLINAQNNSYTVDYDIAFEYAIQIDKLLTIATTVGCDEFNGLDNIIERLKNNYARIEERQRKALQEAGEMIRETGKRSIF